MNVYTVTQISNITEIGCYAVFSTLAKATKYAIEFAEENGGEYSEETTWNGFTKTVYCGKFEFEIWEHRIDEQDS